MWDLPAMLRIALQAGAGCKVSDDRISGKVSHRGTEAQRRGDLNRKIAKIAKERA